MESKDLAIFRVGDDFDEAGAVGQDRGLTVGREWESSDLYLKATLFGLRLGQSGTCDFGRGIDTGRDLLIVDRLDVAAGHVLDGEEPSRRRDVREPGRRYTVADAVDRGHVRLHHAVDLDIAALVGLDSDF